MAKTNPERDRLVKEKARELADEVLGYCEDFGFEGIGRAELADTARALVHIIDEDDADWRCEECGVTEPPHFTNCLFRQP